MLLLMGDVWPSGPMHTSSFRRSLFEKAMSPQITKELEGLNSAIQDDTL